MNYISREEAIQELEFICENKILSKEGTYALCIALDEMKSNSRPKGKWIEYPDCLKYDGALLGEDFACSNCEAVWSAIDNEGERFKFCPNCGADMRGEE